MGRHMFQFHGWSEKDLPLCALGHSAVRTASKGTTFGTRTSMKPVPLRAHARCKTQSQVLSPDRIDFCLEQSSLIQTSMSVCQSSLHQIQPLDSTVPWISVHHPWTDTTKRKQDPHHGHAWVALRLEAIAFRLDPIATRMEATIATRAKRVLEHLEDLERQRPGRGVDHQVVGHHSRS